MRKDLTRALNLDANEILAPHLPSSAGYQD
jgi:hypothetical protein